MRRDAMIENCGVEACERHNGRRRDESIEQYRDAVAARRKRRAGYRGKFASAYGCRHRQGIAKFLGMTA